MVFDLLKLASATTPCYSLRKNGPSILPGPGIALTLLIIRRQKLLIGCAPQKTRNGPDATFFTFCRMIRFAGLVTLRHGCPSDLYRFACSSGHQVFE